MTEKMLLVSLLLYHDVSRGHWLPAGGLRSLRSLRTLPQFPASSLRDNLSPAGALPLPVSAGAQASGRQPLPPRTRICIRNYSSKALRWDSRTASRTESGDRTFIRGPSAHKSIISLGLGTTLMATRAFEVSHVMRWLLWSGRPSRKRACSVSHSSTMD